MGENREYLTQSASDGSINISEDVVVAIASEAIGEIEGVGAMMTTMTEQLTEQFMGKKPARGIRMDIQDGEITLDVYLTVKYGFAIPETAAKVQDAVMSAVETAVRRRRYSLPPNRPDTTTEQPMLEPTATAMKIMVIG